MRPDWPAWGVVAGVSRARVCVGRQSHHHHDRMHRPPELDRRIWRGLPTLQLEHAGSPGNPRLRQQCADPCPDLLASGCGRDRAHWDMHLHRLRRRSDGAETYAADFNFARRGYERLRRRGGDDDEFVCLGGGYRQQCRQHARCNNQFSVRNPHGCMAYTKSGMDLHTNHGHLNERECAQEFSAVGGCPGTRLRNHPPASPDTPEIPQHSGE